MKYTPEQLEKIIVKARLLDKLNQLETKCGHAMYLLKDILDGVTILYIPDDVECAEEKKPINGFPESHPTYCDIECKTLLVSGSRNLMDATRMFYQCKAQSLDLSSFDTSNVTTMTNMFCECEAQSIDLSNF